MRTITLTRALPGYLQGAVLTVDENSAKSLVERGDAEYTDAPTAPTPAVEPAVGTVLTRQSPKPELVEFAVLQGWTGEQASGSTRAEIADAFGLE